MKNIKIVSLAACMVWMLSLMFFTSCSNDDSESVYSGAPVIETVSKSGYDEAGNLLPSTPATIGDPKNYYIIHGKGLSTTTKIYFNDFDTYFRPTFVTDTDIVVLIDEDTPYADASNKLKVVTQKGTAEFDFMIAPPVPTFTSFNRINAAEGDLVTIKGKYFLNPVVTLAKTATLPAVPVTVMSSTLEQIVVKIPANANRRYLSVANISGSATAVEAIGTALYDEELYGVQWGGPWAGKGVNFAFTGDAYQGEKSWQWEFGQWDGGNWGFNIDVTPYKAMRIAIKGSKNGRVNFNINGGANYVLNVTTSWVYMEIPFTELGNPTNISMLTFQESNGDGGNTVLFDDIGFVLK
ncbi:hypothetical protein ACEN2I_00785 [Flavobacterium sp. W22_SRS_FK3]|uniref:IPT/TIG domain-containing protein n=1 Tax=Flavobacterium sp. W22_SRS_FK3 TaxID=3240275 RepID=UPI003F933A17